MPVANGIVRRSAVRNAIVGVPCNWCDRGRPFGLMLFVDHMPGGLWVGFPNLFVSRLVEGAKAQSVVDPGRHPLIFRFSPTSENSNPTMNVS